MQGSPHWFSLMAVVSKDVPSIIGEIKVKLHWIFLFPDKLVSIVDLIMSWHGAQKDTYTYVHTHPRHTPTHTHMLAFFSHTHTHTPLLQPAIAQSKAMTPDLTRVLCHSEMRADERVYTNLV